MDPNRPDVFTVLSHRLIRQACGDDFDPFMLPGGAHFEKHGIQVRACYYYAVVMTADTTVMFDNHGRGGMCDLAPHEIVAAWDTARVMASQGLSPGDLDACAEPGACSSPLPAPKEVVDDLAQDEKSRQWLAQPPSPGYAEKISLTQLLRNDRKLLVTLVLALPGAEPVDPVEPVDPPATLPRPRGLG